MSTDPGEDLHKDHLVHRLDAADIAPAVIWRCPAGCLVARAWWAADPGIVVLDQPMKREGFAASIKAQNRKLGYEDDAPGEYDPNTLWIETDSRPWQVRVECRRHARRGLSLGESPEIVERVRNAAATGRTLTVRLTQPSDKGPTR